MYVLSDEKFRKLQEIQMFLNRLSSDVRRGEDVTILLEKLERNVGDLNEVVNSAEKPKHFLER